MEYSIIYYLAMMGFGQIIKHYSTKKGEYTNFLKVEEERHLSEVRDGLVEVTAKFDGKDTEKWLYLAELLIAEIRDISYQRISANLFPLSKTRYEQCFEYEESVRRGKAYWIYESAKSGWRRDFFDPRGIFARRVGKTCERLEKILFDPELAEHFAGNPTLVDCLPKFKTDIKNAFDQNRCQNHWHFLKSFFSNMEARRDIIKSIAEYHRDEKSIKNIKDVGLNSSVEQIDRDNLSDNDRSHFLGEIKRNLDMDLTYDIGFSWLSPQFTWFTSCFPGSIEDPLRLKEFLNHPSILSDYERIDTKDRNTYLVDRMAHFDVIFLTGKFGDLATKNEVVKLSPSITTDKQEDRIKYHLLSIYASMYKRWRKIDSLADHCWKRLCNVVKTVPDLFFSWFDTFDDATYYPRCFEKLVRSGWIDFGYNTPKSLLEVAVLGEVNQLHKEKEQESVKHLAESLKSLPQTIVDVDGLKVDVAKLKQTVNIIMEGNSQPGQVLQMLIRVLNSVGTSVEDLQKQKQGIMSVLDRFLKKIEDDDSAATVNELVCLIRDIRNELTVPPHTSQGTGSNKQ